MIANILGLSIGWVLGEYFGQLALKSINKTIGIITAAFVFELAVWIARLLPSKYFENQRPLRMIDTFIWLGIELFGWVVFSFIESDTALLTAEVVFLTSMGVSFWIIFSAFGLLGREKQINPTNWFAKAFLYALGGFVLGNIFVSFVTTTAISINYSLGKINLFLGLGTGGAFMGLFFGAVTGWILVASIDWINQYRLENKL